MPVNMKKYGPGWRLFTATIKVGRAHGQCECHGQCGLHRFHRCQEYHKAPARFAHGRVCLTTAHLCSCDPPCHIPAHVIAACQRCHLRIDIALHLAHRRAKRTGAPVQLPRAFEWPDTPTDPTPAPPGAS